MTEAENKRRFKRSLEIHRLYPLGQYEVPNCVMLCRVCHAKRPKGKNTPWLRTGDYMPLPLNGEQLCKLDIVRFFFQSKSGYFIPRDEVIHAAMEYIIDLEGLCRRPENKVALKSYSRWLPE